jgi:hypothetical protein
LNEVATCLAGLYDFHSYLSSETNSKSRGQWLAIGINGLIRKRIDALAQGAYTDEGLSSLKSVRDQLAHSLEYADQGIGMLSERLELGNLVMADQDTVRHVAGAVAHYVPDDSPLACDPDEHIE